MKTGVEWQGQDDCSLREDGFKAFLSQSVPGKRPLAFRVKTRWRLPGLITSVNSALKSREIRGKVAVIGGGNVAWTQSDPPELGRKRLLSFTAGCRKCLLQRKKSSSAGKNEFSSKPNPTCAVHQQQWPVKAIECVKMRLTEPMRADGGNRTCPGSELRSKWML